MLIMQGLFRFGNFFMSNHLGAKGKLFEICEQGFISMFRINFIGRQLEDKLSFESLILKLQSYIEMWLDMIQNYLFTFSNLIYFAEVF